MTISLSEAARPLLEPGAFHVAGEIAEDPSIVPKQPGIYGWWFDDALIDRLPMSESLLLAGRRLLYVGIAPNGARRTTGRRTLRDRLKNHCRGPIGSSTLRRTVASLVVPELLDLTVSRTLDGKPMLSSADEARLTDWMSEHLRVAWMVHPQPWELEEALIVEGPRLPLNIMGSRDPFVATLKQLRRGLAGDGAVPLLPACKRSARCQIGD